jgi:hypothetical protein
MGVPPIKMTALLFEFRKHPDIGTIEGPITEKHFISLSQETNKCSDHPDGNLGFQDCSRNYFKNILQDTANCTIPGRYCACLFYSIIIVLLGNTAKINECLIIKYSLAAIGIIFKVF